MSTILDALRKVQDERRPRDLQESVALSTSASRPRRWPRLLLGLILLGSVGAGGAWLWQSPQGAELWQAYLVSEDVGREQPAAAADTPSAPGQTEHSKARRARVARDLNRAAAEHRTAGAARAAAAPETADSGKPPEASGRSASVAGEPAASAEPAGPIKVASKPVGKDRPKIRRRAPTGPTLARPRTVLADPVDDPALALEPHRPVPRPEINLSMRLEPLARKTPEEGPVEIFMTRESALAFPELSLELVSWHPVAERRSARIRLDGTRPINAREGDIIAGVAIERIDPGAIQVRMGDALQLIQLGQ